MYVANADFLPPPRSEGNLMGTVIAARGSLLRVCMLGLLASWAIGSLGQAVGGENVHNLDVTVDGMHSKLVELRRDIYRHPELSNREQRTSGLIVEWLRRLNIDEIRTNVAHHGVVAVLHGSGPGATVAVRADLDALPVQDALDVPYRSVVPGVKHACGHDVHTTVALGVAEVMANRRNQFSGSVKFIFQPAEEGAPPGEEGGAALMIREGALENPRPGAIFALHTSPELDVGTIGYRAGPAQAAAAEFSIVINGKAAHAALPEAGVDAITVAAECVTALQTIRSRKVSTFEPMVLTIGTIKGGDRANILAGEVTMAGTIRCFGKETFDRVAQLMRETLDGVTAANQARYQLTFSRSTPTVINHPELVNVSLPAIREMVGAPKVIEIPQRMTAEDFSHYGEIVPAFMFRLGCGDSSRGFAPLSHTAQFDVDERCLDVGVKVMTNLLLSYLSQHQDASTPQIPKNPAAHPSQ